MSQTLSHSLYKQLFDESTSIQLAREELYDSLEKSHLLQDDINPSYRNDCEVAMSSYNYAKKNQCSQHTKEIIRAVGFFQKKVNNSRIGIENVSKKYSMKQNNICCQACEKNIRISLVLLDDYFKHGVLLRQSLYENAVSLQLLPESSSSYSSSSAKSI